MAQPKVTTANIVLASFAVGVIAALYAFQSHTSYHDSWFGTIRGVALILFAGGVVVAAGWYYRRSTGDRS